ncbi:MAG: type II secretion system GspH family protein [Candidatus Gastranaerophilales bacterium]|nr:type II secretion system GspH family protein [Candidatus Gastranaerophilales bacterium]
MNYFAVFMPALRKTKYFIAFTLAETLITLAIIGVVAAMTIPAVINRTHRKELQTAFMKQYSELNKLAQAFYAANDISISEYTQVNGLSALTDVFTKYMASQSLTTSGQGTLNSEGDYDAYYTMHYLNGQEYSGGKNSNGKNSSFLCDNSVFKNEPSGALYVLNDAPASGKNGPVVCVDVNGENPPNRYGVDFFMFIFTIHGNVIPMGLEDEYNVTAACTISNGSCGNFFNSGSKYCDKDSTNITYNSSCAYYALLNDHPTKEGKDYWKDFLSEI